MLWPMESGSLKSLGPEQDTSHRHRIVSASARPKSPSKSPTNASGSLHKRLPSPPPMDSQSQRDFLDHPKNFGRSRNKGKCEACCLAIHRTTPFHRPKKWNGKCFKKVDLDKLGLTIFFGHGGDPCPLLSDHSGVPTSQPLDGDGDLDMEDPEDNGWEVARVYLQGFRGKVEVYLLEVRGFGGRGKDPAVGVYSVLDADGTQIDTPWPLDLDDYQVCSKIHSHGLYHAPTDKDNLSIIGLNAKACILLHQAVRMKGHLHSIPGVSTQNVKAFNSLEQLINSLRAQLSNLAQIHAHSSLRTILLTRSLLNAATINLHGIYRNPDAASRQKCLAAARDMFCFGVDTTTLQQFNYLNPMMLPSSNFGWIVYCMMIRRPWMMACSVIIELLAVLWLDHEELNSCLEDAIGTFKIFAHGDMLMKSREVEIQAGQDPRCKVPMVSPHKKELEKPPDPIGIGDRKAHFEPKYRFLNFALHLVYSPTSTVILCSEDSPSPRKSSHFTEINPDVFCLNRLSSVLDSGRSVVELQENTKLEPPEATLAGFKWCELPDASLVVDLGGGAGSTTLVITKAVTHVNLIVQDRSSVFEDAKTGGRITIDSAGPRRHRSCWKVDASGRKVSLGTIYPNLF
ncbi:hypothetical protein B0H14DRAFT_2581172 [Mycena olivaceomarginata]|nr:hypothetical protein B0H14DRAFT_2581172 [Mycena olivaceomarginata]